MMRAENFFIKTEGELRRRGFNQTLFLETSNDESAELTAVDPTRDSDFREAVRNEADDPPTCFVEEITRLESFEVVASMIQGRVFYPIPADENA